MGIECFNENSKKHKNRNCKLPIILVKSKYIIQNIFSYLQIEKKLSIIKNNKKLQNLLDVDIQIYKKLCNKLILLDIDGRVQELSINHKIIFEGNYLNMKRNGKGEEYEKNELGSILKFKGNYLNGKRNGKGEEYYNNGILQFEGKYLNGKRNGKGKEYYNNGKLKFEGKYLNDKEWDGKCYDYNGIEIYEIINGEGYILKYDEDKLIFEGVYLNGEKNGLGKEYYCCKVLLNQTIEKNRIYINIYIK